MDLLSLDNAGKEATQSTLHNSGRTKQNRLRHTGLHGESSLPAAISMTMT